MKLSEQLKEWYGMPEFQPSKVDAGILDIIDGIATLEAQIANYPKIVTDLQDGMKILKDDLQKAYAQVAIKQEALGAIVDYTCREETDADVWVHTVAKRALSS